MRSTTLLLVMLCCSVASYGQKTFMGCKDVGRNKAGKLPSVREQGLNVRKNRSKIPTAPQAMTIAQLVKAKEETDLNFNKSATVRAFVVSVEDGEAQETCNCARTDLKDIHIKVVAKESDAADKTKFVVVEITPRFEGKLGQTADLKSLENHWVTFTGWLTYDYIHRGNAYNRKRKKGPGVWRATAWELHPITSFILE
jgi:hypothetical protein